MITEIKINRRPNTSVPFYDETTSTYLVQAQNACAPYKTAGNITVSETYSSDQLTKTKTTTFDSLATYNAIENILTVQMDNEYLNYARTNSFISLDYTVLENRRNTYTQTGIDQPFTVTTTYTFPAVAPEDYSGTQLIVVFSNALETYPDGISKKKNIILDENTVTIVHQYDNSSDFTDNLYNDLFYVPQLAEKGVTRTITYALV